MKYRRMKEQDIQIWHDWFAWRPVALMQESGYTEVVVWLETVSRRARPKRSKSPHPRVVGGWEYKQ